MKKEGSLKEKACLIFLCLSALILSSLVLLSFPALAADDSVCARVKLEIKQELTLERQAFDAHMRITNGLSHITLEDVDVDVIFSDEEGVSVLASSDPDNSQALFFIRLDSMENIDDVNGTGSVEPSSFADIHWLIIPAPGSANGVPHGTLYYVGATLTYTIGGEEHITDVTPDYIFVKPMPELVLDYFLPTDVYGDDAFTPEIEPPIPFFLGVRVKNNGSGIAKDMKINSAQPKIVENEQGLLIGFVIEGCEVNGKAATPSLLADLGDIEPNRSSVARWVMTCSLSGQFVEFTADYSHSDELGGELTSLLEGVNTHFLVRDVLVDVAGRDSVRDFLAKDGDVYRVYESENIDTEVADQSAASGLTGSGDNYTLSTPPTSGFIYVQLTDPQQGQKEIKEIMRSDGKRIKPENAWLSKTRNKEKEWDYFLNIFDANTTGSYTVSFGEPAAIPHAPVLQFIPDRTVVEGEQLSFLVEATDEDATTPSLEAEPLPAQASFTDQGDGTGLFDWTPREGQAGQYSITFTASDELLEDSQRVVITVNPVDDTDGDGMLDAWEMDHFGTLDRDGTGDFDGDGISDLDEFLNETDPTLPNQVPTIPVIQTPEPGAEVAALKPALVIENSIDPDGDTVAYIFELYADEEMTILEAEAFDVPEGVDTTSRTIPAELSDDTWYFWRVRATDGFSFTQWAYGTFFVNTENDPPGAFNISRPMDNSEVDTQTPALEVSNSVDVDEDTLTYTFEIYADSALVASGLDIGEGEDGSTSWTVDTPLNDGILYYWRAIATDEHGATAETPLVSFLVNADNAAPKVPVISAPAPGSEVDLQELGLVVNNTTDSDGDPLLYFFELDKINTFDSTEKQTSQEISEGVDTTTIWHVDALEDNTRYFWRVKASDRAAESTWAQGSFFVNTENNSPSTPTLKNPGHGAWVSTRTPTLELNPARDPDHDGLTYLFELYADAPLTNLVDQEETYALQWTLSSPVNDSTWYYWRMMAVDEHGAGSAWAGGASFFVKDNGVDDPPEIKVLVPAEGILTNGQYILIEWEDSDPDSNADITLYYDADSTGEDGTLITEGFKEDPDGLSDTFLWDITAMSDGTYYVYATITDGNSTVTSYAPGAITINRTPPSVSATPSGGMYISTQSVALSADEPAEIYFTTDGTEPTTASLPYTSPIEISEDTTLKVMAVDAVGNQSRIITETYKFNQPPVANPGGPYISDEGTSITFDASKSNDVNNDQQQYKWDFNNDELWDTGYSSDPTATYTWYDDYSGIVAVEVSDGEFTNTATTNVTVNNVAPIVNARDDQIVNEGAAVTFSGSFTDPGADTHTIEWDFGDGDRASGTLTPTHAYGDNGTYTVTLAVEDDDGGEGSDTLTVTVKNLAPTITSLMSDSPANGEIHLSATFEDKGWLDSHIGTFVFGDGAVGVVEPDATGTITGTHNYSEEGTYTVILVVEDDDDGGRSEPKTTEVLIDKTPPVITISEPKAKYYYNTQDITIDFEVEDPIGNGVSSGLVEQSATLDGQVVEAEDLIDLSELGDGTHTFKVKASDLAGNEVEEVVIFEVGPVLAMIHIEPHKWNLGWLDPFDDLGGKKRIRAYISLGNVEVEAILPTFAAPMLKVGKGYGDFVVLEVIAAEGHRRHGRSKIRSATLRYVGTDEVDILASSGNKTWDFYGVKEGDTITIDAGEGEHLGSYTVLSYYTCEPPLYSAADIIPETVLLNGKVPIIEGSAELITEEPSQLDQPRVIAEEPLTIVKDGRHHVCLSDLGDPESITLEVGSQTIFEDEPYPIRWHDRFSLEEDGQVQMIRIYASKKGDMLNIIHHNLQEEARIYLDGTLALTILPDVRLVVLRVQFNRFDAISSLPKEVLERDGDWEVTTYEGVRLLGKHSRKHIKITDLGDLEKVKLVVGDSVIFDDEPFPIRWEDKCFIVDGERQDMSIYTYGRSWRKKYLSINCKRLTKDAKLYLDGELVLVISPPPDVEVSIAGGIELDDDPETFDGSFSGTDEIELKGKIPHNYDIDKTYQRINTSGSPALEVGDMFGDFEMVDFTEGYDDYRITTIEFRYDGKKEKVVEVYEDSKGRHLIGSFEVDPGETFSVDVSDVEGDKVYLKVGHKRKDIRLAGKGAADVGNRYLDCTIIDATTRPVGPPHYIDLTLEYIGSAEPISITAYDGKWQSVIGTYEADPAFEPFTIDGSELHRGHIGGDLVLEY